MLHRVPVARILGFLFVATILLLSGIVYEGYRISAEEITAGRHIRFALFGIVVILFTHTMTLFYFVGTGSRIKKVVREYRLPASLFQRTLRFKARLFPWLTFTPLVTMVTFIIGGGAHTKVLPAWIHGILALAALGMNMVTGVLALQCIAENVMLIDEIDDALPEDAGE